MGLGESQNPESHRDRRVLACHGSGLQSFPRVFAYGVRQGHAVGPASILEMRLFEIQVALDVAHGLVADLPVIAGAQ